MIVDIIAVRIYSANGFVDNPTIYDVISDLITIGVYSYYVFIDYSSVDNVLSDLIGIKVHPPGISPYQPTIFLVLCGAGAVTKPWISVPELIMMIIVVPSMLVLFEWISGPLKRPAAQR